MNARRSAPPNVTPPSARESSTPAPPRSPVLLAVLATTGVLVAVGVAFVVGITLAGRPTEASPPAAPPALGGPAAPIDIAVVDPRTPPSPTIDVRLRAVPATAEIVLDGALVSNGSYSRSLPRDGIPHMIEVRAIGFIPHRIEFLDVAPVAEIVLEPVPSHHRGPIEPRRSAMTEAGLVAAPPTATSAPLVAPPTLTPEPEVAVAPIEPVVVIAPPVVEPPVVEPPVVAPPIVEPPPVVVPPVVVSPTPDPPPGDWGSGVTPGDDLVPFPTQ